MRLLASTRSVITLLSVVAVILAGCADGSRGPTRADAGPCQIVSNGTPMPKPPAAPPSAAPPTNPQPSAPPTTPQPSAPPTTPQPSAPPTTRDLATHPEIGTGYRSDMTAVRTSTYAVATANPLATEAACKVLRDGGTAADALVTAQAVLGLVEPQSSGIGGGGFLLYYDAAGNAVRAFDGRETAPAAATENYLRWVSDTDRTVPKPDSRSSGRSIGVPGIVRLLDDVHHQFGKKVWRELFAPAVSMADQGFDISPRLAAAIDDADTQLRLDPAAAGYFLNPDGSPKPVGTRMTNPAYAKTLGAIASDGATAFYTGDIARAVVAATADGVGGRTPGAMTEQDLAGYTVKQRDPVCTTYRGREVCGMPPPSSGGIAVAATLGMLEHFPMSDYKPARVDLNGGHPSVMGVHLVSEAERLAYADRDRYVADTDFVPLPGGSSESLLGGAYLTGRAALISRDHTMGVAAPGNFAPPMTIPPAPEHGTSQISVIDSFGNAASLTTTIESAFGSFHMVDGFLLNNQLTDFSAEPVSAEGTPIPNRVQPGKRPRSTMAPTLVFDKAGSQRGPLYAVLGSPGGSVIVQFVVKTLVGMMDWNLDPQQAVSMIDFGAANTPVTNVGGEHPAVDTVANGDRDQLVAGLRALGHQVSLADQSSGLSALVRTSPTGWIGGADPRREGLVLGDAG
ncbi:gamma-glutamyltransferase family protein [Mycolicibacterium fortuitum]|uniref:Gamma-glutamyltransferase family protein n=1 Tax=Mycolicibacterium fortuitum TaxID=1766 RepID=A0AAE5AB29_MYCFO|nr:gamma-glutamyltransferase family protein [Mycolicibacterium fortuitum]MCV7140221.1 gamma-glutamyltransferase family protein [Mycolicibacterium fortuitum]MDV7190259.1 gamma-glutamyltransferase family protein [Mycolicibacterium fortuitum]MDV7204790.1 gamma-glutamyltransferase family protein [Mycolicibacterium fortuitum]MDV7227799.1 gamma-glutamyltransferase family protein [Mycolicibacterium fortuitum]MDV7257504.1 gamma-glutamyltransferase family protein [Mycolicibacterium fortuitum]